MRPGRAHFSAASHGHGNDCVRMQHACGRRSGSTDAEPRDLRRARGAAAGALSLWRRARRGPASRVGSPGEMVAARALRCCIAARRGPTRAPAGPAHLGPILGPGFGPLGHLLGHWQLSVLRFCLLLGYGVHSNRGSDCGTLIWKVYERILKSPKLAIIKFLKNF